MTALDTDALTPDEHAAVFTRYEASLPGRMAAVAAYLTARLLTDNPDMPDGLRFTWEERQT